MNLTSITRNAENQLAGAAQATAKRFLSARLDKHREEDLRKLIREVNDLATLYGQLHPVPPPPVATPKPLPPVGSSLSPLPPATPPSPGFNL